MSEFDLTVHHKDPRTSKIVRVTPYRMKCVKTQHGVTQYMVRDGRYYWANGVELSDQQVMALEGTKVAESAVADMGQDLPPQAALAQKSVAPQEKVPEVITYPVESQDQDLSKKLFGKE